jgi:hypothetical protein
LRRGGLARAARRRRGARRGQHLPQPRDALRDGLAVRQVGARACQRRQYGRGVAIPERRADLAQRELEQLVAEQHPDAPRLHDASRPPRARELVGRHSPFRRDGVLHRLRPAQRVRPALVPLVPIGARRHRAARQRERERRVVERGHGQQSREAPLQLAHASLALRREMMRHARRQLHAERGGFRVEDCHAVRPVGHSQRRAVSRAEAADDALRQGARPRRVVARDHQLSPRRQCARREGQQRLLRRGVAVEHVHVVHDDQPGARELIQQELRCTAAHRCRKASQKIVRREQLRRAERVAQRCLRRHGVREVRFPQSGSAREQDRIVQPARRHGRSRGGSIRSFVAPPHDEMREGVPGIEGRGHALR